MKPKYCFILLLVVFIGSLLTGCSSGPSDEEIRNAFTQAGQLEFVLMENSKIVEKNNCEPNKDSSFSEAWEIKYILCDSNNKCLDTSKSAVVGKRTGKEWSLILVPGLDGLEPKTSCPH